MSAQFAQAIADLRLVLPAEKIAKLEALDDYDLIAPLLTKHRQAIKKSKSAPPELPLDKRQAKAWGEILDKPPSDDFKGLSKGEWADKFRQANIKDTATFATDKATGGVSMKIKNPRLIEMFYDLMAGAKAESDKRVATKKVSGNRRGRLLRADYKINYTNTPDNPEGKGNKYCFNGDENVVFERDGKIADNINGGPPIKKVTYKAVKREQDFIAGNGRTICPGAVQWERAMGSDAIKRLGKTHATFRLQCGQDRGDADEYCSRCQRKGSKVENFFEGVYGNGQSYVDFIVENTNTDYCPPAKAPVEAESDSGSDSDSDGDMEMCQKCGKTEKDFDPDDFDGPALTTYAVNGKVWCPDCISDDCNR
mgnify:CR=1 FL=1|jgi:hypothetical protein